jgi:hypothetical protein
MGSSSMKKNRNQLIALATLIVGLVFLYQPRYILLKGIALPLLSLSAILSSTSFSKRRIVEITAAVVLAAGFTFLYLPVSMESSILSILHGSAFHLLFASAIAFGMTTHLKKISGNCGSGHRRHWTSIPLSTLSFSVHAGPAR